MQKTVWLLAIVGCLSTITLAVVVSRPESQPTDLGIVKARAFVIVDEKGETLGSIAPIGQGYPGIGIVFGRKSSNASIILMCAPDGTVSISAADGRIKSKADLFIGIDGSSAILLSRGNKGEQTASMGIDMGGPYMRLSDKDAAILDANAHDGVRLLGSKKSLEATTKTSKE